MHILSHFDKKINEENRRASKERSKIEIEHKLPIYCLAGPQLNSFDKIPSGCQTNFMMEPLTLQPPFQCNGPAANLAPQTQASHVPLAAPIPVSMQKLY